MTFDVPNASVVAGGENSLHIRPIEVKGLKVNPGLVTPSSQVTGAGATVLRAALTSGLILIFGYLKALPSVELTVATGNNYLTLGQGQVFTAVALKHKNAGAIHVVWVPGAISATPVAATYAQILAFLGLGQDDAYLVILGDITFTRSADTVITYSASDVRRPDYTFIEMKDIPVRSVANQANLSLVEGGYVDFAVTLATLSGITPGNLVIDGASLPRWPQGGRIERLEYIGAVAGAGASASVTLKAQIDGVVVVGSDLVLPVAGTALPSTIQGGTPSSAASFGPGAGFDLEVDTVANTFSAGSGVVRVHLSKYE